MGLILTFLRPENVPRLFDLIQMENEDFKPAFYYGLRDTLVATNLDQATRVAYGNTRFRVVTLGGDLIEISGIYVLIIYINLKLTLY